MYVEHMPFTSTYELHPHQTEPELPPSPAEAQQSNPNAVLYDFIESSAEGRRQASSQLHPMALKVSKLLVGAMASGKNSSFGRVRDILNKPAAHGWDGDPDDSPIQELRHTTSFLAHRGRDPVISREQRRIGHAIAIDRLSTLLDHTFRAVHARRDLDGWMAHYTALAALTRSWNSKTPIAALSTLAILDQSTIKADNIDIVAATDGAGYGLQVKRRCVRICGPDKPETSDTLESIQAEYSEHVHVVTGCDLGLCGDDGDRITTADLLVYEQEGKATAAEKRHLDDVTEHLRMIMTNRMRRGKVMGETYYSNRLQEMVGVSTGYWPPEEHYPLGLAGRMAS